MSDQEFPNEEPVASHPEPGEQAMPAADAELLAAFDRMSPQGSLAWGFDDAMRRITHPDVASTTGADPWPGLPDDLWMRGRSARIGQRFVGDVAGVLAELLAADARSVAGAAVAGANTATWDALRYLAARVAMLEARVDPSGVQVAELATAPPDLSEWLDAIPTWLGTTGADGRVLVGESGDGVLLQTLREAGWRARGVEPRGTLAWRSLEALGRTGDDGAPAVTFGNVLGHLGSLDDVSCGAIILAGCVDRADLAGNLALLAESLRVLEAEGTLVVLTTDQASWERSRSAPERDLSIGHPLHPETWLLLLARTGLSADWHRPATGSVHAIVARRPA
jgi:hypothetical protein